MSWMGIDIGTTGCKAVVFDDEGRIVSQAYREYPVLLPEEGWAELDSARVMDDCFDIIAEAAKKAGGDAPKAIGVSSQGEAFTPVGPDGSMLENGMVSSDTRALGEVCDFTGDYGPYTQPVHESDFDAERLYRITGHTAHPMFTLFKMLWTRKNRQATWNSAAKFLCYEDLLQARLGIEPVISWPLAVRTMLFDVTKHEWSAEILDEIGLSADRLATPAPSGSVAGEIPAALCESLNLAPGAVVVTGGHDQTCGALGAGVTKPGLAVYATGTVECITPCFAKAVFSKALRQANLATYDHTVKGMSTTVAFSLTGGNLLKWFRDEWGQAETAEAKKTGADPYDLLMNQIPDEPTRLMVLPYFTPSGTPHFDATTPGAIVGLRLSTTRGEILRGLLEGVALEMRLNVEILEEAGSRISEFRAIGGGARSRALTQLKADVLQRPITTVEVTEAGCLGAAMLARSATTGEDVAALAERWVRTGPAVEPNPAHKNFYANKMEQYRRLYPAIRNYYGFKKDDGPKWIA